MKRVQKEIEDNLMNLRKRIETTEELAIEEVSSVIFNIFRCFNGIE